LQIEAGSSFLLLSGWMYPFSGPASVPKFLISGNFRKLLKNGGGGNRTRVRKGSQTLSTIIAYVHLFRVKVAQRLRP